MDNLLSSSLIDHSRKAGRANIGRMTLLLRVKYPVFPLSVNAAKPAIHPPTLSFASPSYRSCSLILQYRRCLIHVLIPHSNSIILIISYHLLSGKRHGGILPLSRQKTAHVRIRDQQISHHRWLQNRQLRSARNTTHNE